VEIVDRRAYASVSEDWWIMKIALITIGFLRQPLAKHHRHSLAVPYIFWLLGILSM
jgi:lipid-A-disaccharide synthase-like uncharacterized protein